MVAYSPRCRAPPCENPFRQTPRKAHHASSLDIPLLSAMLHVPGGCLVRDDGHELERCISKDVQDHMPGFVVGRFLYS